MFSFILKRLFYGVLVLLGVVSVLFFLFSILPGDPSRMMLGQRSDILSVEAIQKELGLDKPVMERYFNYLNDLSVVSVHHKSNPDSYWYLDSLKYTSAISLFSVGEKVVVLKAPYLRRSYQSKRTVNEVLAEAIPRTMVLAVLAILIAFFLGVLLGVIGALYKDTWIDKLSLFFSVIGMSVPSFFAAILIAWVFAYVLKDYTHLNMVGSLYEVDDFGRGEYLSLKNLILPAITLGIRPLAIVAELTRSSMLQVMGQDYIRTARAKGLNTYQIVRHHALKNALNPVITAVTGWFASLMAGAVFIEYVFDWKGVGVVIVSSLEKYDFPVIMGSVLFISVVLVFINIFADILYGVLDPRVRIN